METFSSPSLAPPLIKQRGYLETDISSLSLSCISVLLWAHCCSDSALKLQANWSNGSIWISLLNRNDQMLFCLCFSLHLCLWDGSGWYDSLMTSIHQYNFTRYRWRFYSNTSLLWLLGTVETDYLNSSIRKRCILWEMSRFNRLSSDLQYG